jgi:hypothetical protein
MLRMICSFFVGFTEPIILNNFHGSDINMNVFLG